MGASGSVHVVFEEGTEQPLRNQRGVRVVSVLESDKVGKEGERVDVKQEMEGLVAAQSVGGVCTFFQMPKRHRWLTARHGEAFRVRFSVDGQTFEREIADTDITFTIRSHYHLEDRECDRLIQKTSFSDDELRALYLDFLEHAWPRRRFPCQAFMQLFPAFAVRQELVYALFHPEPEEGLSFSEYAKLLSVATRGSVLERSALSFTLLRNAATKGAAGKSATLRDLFGSASAVQEVMLLMKVPADEIGDPSALLPQIFFVRSKPSRRNRSKSLAKRDAEGSQSSDFSIKREDLPIEEGGNSNGGDADVTMGKEWKVDSGPDRSGVDSKRVYKEALDGPNSGEFPDIVTEGMHRPTASERQWSSTLLIARVLRTEASEDNASARLRSGGGAGSQESLGLDSAPDSAEMSDGEFTIAETVTQRDFVGKACGDSDIINCFGLFYFLRHHLVQPALSILPPRRSELSGELLKQKGNSLAYQAVSFFSYDRRTVFVRDGFLAWCKPGDDQLREAVYIGEAVLQTDSDARYFYIETPVLQRWFLAEDRRMAQRWLSAIRSNRLEDHRFRSFAPTRMAENCRWFVNARDYYEELLRVLPLARRRVFIAGWYLCPGLYLRRSHPLDAETRLDNVLVACASRGVRVFVLIWHNSELAFDLQSGYVVTQLMKLHGNIKALRHPYVTPITWSHHQKLVVIDEALAYVGGIDLAYGRYEDGRYALTDPDEQVYPGRDYNNLIHGSETNGPSLQSDAVMARDRMHRMPWHDVHVGVHGLAARDVAINFVQRWNHNARHAPVPTEPLLPSLDEEWQTFARRLSPLGNNSASVASQTSSSLSSTPAQAGLGWFENCRTQVVRSMSPWAGGVTEPEKSIYKAYLELISGAERLIYIENQYFISSISRNNPKNRILKALYSRLKRAIRNEEAFRVVVVLPVFPAGNLQAASTRYIIKHVYKAVSRQGHSLLERLARKFPNTSLTPYITFHSLRSHGELAGRLISEQVYVHSKILLVDDRVAVVGSANINDRSMLGTRDSELAVIIEQAGDALQPGVLAGDLVSVSPFVRSLRMRLMNGHLGLPLDSTELEDPVVGAGAARWTECSKSNSQIYAAVFPLTTPDAVTSLSQLRHLTVTMGSLLDDPDASGVQNWRQNQLAKLAELQGQLVDFSHGFLSREFMNPTIFDSEFILPKSTFL